MSPTMSDLDHIRRVGAPRGLVLLGPGAPDRRCDPARNVHTGPISITPQHGFRCEGCDPAPSDS